MAFAQHLHGFLHGFCTALQGFCTAFAQPFAWHFAWPFAWPFARPLHALLHSLCTAFAQQDALFLQVSPCHLVSLLLSAFEEQQLRRMLQALQYNKSIKELDIVLFSATMPLVFFEELFHHKTNLTNVIFSHCFFRISDALVSGLTQLTKLKLFSSHLGDEGL
jgi:hypothetical protein